jgi:indole-3-glycerol phosphate synthase
VIAELKRRSPSKGVINADLAADAQAAAYAAGGAAALSILTEPTMFGGALHDLHIAREGSALPLIRKDFLVDAVQLAEARAAGASGALLIARALGPAALGALAADARALGVEPVVEVRAPDELAWAVDAGATVIGVNTRDLETLAIDPRVGEALLPRVPVGCVAVWESGIASVDDVARAAAAGATAVLVGSSVSAAPDPAAAVRALTGVARRR